MKTTLALILAIAVTATAAPCRFTATWGGAVVEWHEPATGHRWTCSYEDFFSYCGGKHPNAIGVKVVGKLPAWWTERRSKAPPPPRPKPKQIIAAAPTRGAKPSREDTLRPLPPAVTPGAQPTNLLPNALPTSVTLQQASRSMATRLPPQPEWAPQEIVPEPQQESQPSSYPRVMSLLTGDFTDAKPSSAGHDHEDLVNLVKSFEGFKSTRYWDSTQWSIGYGTKARKNEKTITQAEADKRLRSELDRAKKDVIEHAANLRLNEAQIAALTSFHYNTGAIARVVERANGDPAAIPSIIQEWRRSDGKVLKGLVTRRQTESNLYATE